MKPITRLMIISLNGSPKPLTKSIEAYRCCTRELPLQIEQYFRSLDMDEILERFERPWKQLMEDRN